MPNVRYALTVSHVSPELPAVPAPSLYETYRELLDVGTAQRGAVIPSRLWRAGVLGDLQVFRGAPSVSSRIKASAVLLWDWSSSQNAFKPVLTQGLTSIAQALTQLRFRVWAGAYASSRDIRLETGEEGDTIYRNFGSYGTAIAVVQNWGESFDGRRIATLERFERGGGTPTGPALHYVRRRVLPYSGDGRKTLLVLATDGEADDKRHQAAEVRRLSAIPDLTLVNIYCGPHASVFKSMQQVFPHCFWAPDRSKIPAAFAHTLRALRGGI